MHSYTLPHCMHMETKMTLCVFLCHYLILGDDVNHWNFQFLLDWLPLPSLYLSVLTPNSGLIQSSAWFSMGAGNLNSGPPSRLRIKYFTHRTVSWPISIISVQNGPHVAQAILELLMLLPIFPSAEITDVCHHNQLFRWIFNNIKSVIHT